MLAWNPWLRPGSSSNAVPPADGALQRSREPDTSLTKTKRAEAPAAVGKLVAERAKDAGVATVVFDRGGYLYHGRVKALADAARENGLEF